MSNEYQIALKYIYELPANEQIAIVEEIMKLFREREADYQISIETIDENKRRLAEYDAGNVESIPRKEAMAEVRQRRAERREIP